jgi:hypothetical protein
MNGEQQSHDAQKALADLRDHLARHDKPIAFFFGAGTSCSVIVPADDHAIWEVPSRYGSPVRFFNKRPESSVMFPDPRSRSTGMMPSFAL